ncbi:LapA family protein [Ottowia caeni]|uniref:LapA family protein n=1 Tax=Ottowia caeni TaxID=2870339 RepID=UPI003D74893A
MSLRSLFLLIVSALIVIFVGVNWTQMTTPTDLSLIYTDIRAPLGLILLGLMALLSAVFVGLIAYMQATVLVETRRHAKELAVQRDLADKAEASRFTDLRAHLDREVGRLSEAINTHTRETLSRVDRAEMGLRERPVDAEISRLVLAVENHNRDLHARVDRLEMGLREGLAGFTPAPASVLPASSAASLTAPPQQDDLGKVVPS